MTFSLVSEGNFARSMLDPSDGMCIHGGRKCFHISPCMSSQMISPPVIGFSSVFIADTGREVFVWIGSGASDAERKNAMTYAHVNTHIPHHTQPSNRCPPAATHC